MKSRIILFPLTIFVFLVQFAVSQNELPENLAATAKKADAKVEISPELKKSAVEFLRNTAVEVNNMRTLESRISFSAEMAGLMWFDNEREARAMYQNVINNFRQLLAQHDAELNSLQSLPNDAGAMLFGNSQKTLVTKKFRKAMSVRQQIAMSLAEHDSQLAYEFFIEAGEAVSNPEMRKQLEQSDGYFVNQLVKMIADSDIDAALKIARKNLDKGINHETLDLLQKIYSKDADKGIGFGEEIIAEIRKDVSNDEDIYLLYQFLEFGEETRSDRGTEKRAAFSDQMMRDVAEVLAQRLLKRDDGEQFEGYVEKIAKYLPARAAQIRTKFGLKREAASKNGTVKKIGEPLTTTGDLGDPDAEPLAESLESLQNENLSVEDRQKVIDQSRKIIDAIGDRSQKVMALSGLAMQIARLGDKKLAADVLDEARRLTNYQPVNYKDYLETWIIIGAYSKVDAEKAFPILENTVYRLNDTISSFVKVAEFIDVEGDMIEEGEVQLGSFGGGMTRDLLRMVGAADETVRTLSIADFQRTKDLTNRFDRQEVRILAKMLVLRAVLGGSEKPLGDMDVSGF